MEKSSSEAFGIHPESGFAAIFSPENNFTLSETQSIKFSYEHKK